MKCKHKSEVGKCKIKVHYRYNDYCESNDCPLKKKSKVKRKK